MSIPCIICHEIFDSDTDVVVLSGCGHLYHRNCLDDWKRLSPHKGTCPICRKGYDKRSIRKLYFNVEEPEVNAQLSNDLKRQRIFSENLAQQNEKLQMELLQKNVQVDKINQAWSQALYELNKIKTDYGIKCQAYSIIDTVNNEYVQDNLRLKEENLKLAAELETMKQSHKRKLKFVDLTNESDDDLQIIKNSKKSEIIEILDDEESNHTVESLQDKKYNSAKQISENDDYKILEDFILSQI